MDVILEPVEYPYSYISVYKLQGGYSNSKSDEKLNKELYRDTKIQVFLTDDANTVCFNMDRGIALANIKLSMMFGRSISAYTDEVLETEIQRIQEEREEQRVHSLLLIIICTGKAKLYLAKKLLERDEFTYYDEAVNNNWIKLNHTAEIESIISGFSLDVSSPFTVKNIVGWVYYHAENNRIIYSTTSSFGAGGMFVTTSPSADYLARVSQNIALSLKANSKDYGTVFRLYTQMITSWDDTLRAFIFGWNALEILIGKSFNKYEQLFLESLRVKTGSKSVDKYIDRVKEIMNGKYNISDKFNIIAASLFDEADWKNDIEMFKRLKNSRDKFFHGENTGENSLPKAEVKLLLSKYLEKLLV